MGLIMHALLTKLLGSFQSTHSRMSDELIGHAGGADGSGVAMVVARVDRAVRIFRMQSRLPGL